MEVNRVRAGNVAGAAQRARRTGEAGFSLPHTEESAAADPPAPLTGVSAMVLNPALDAARERPSDQETDRKAAAHGESLLQAMARLQRSIVSGGLPAAREDLRKLAEMPIDAADPTLRSLLQAVVQRAAVELAR